jgi:hypothetical protein
VKLKKIRSYINKALTLLANNVTTIARRMTPEDFRITSNRYCPI